MKRIARQIFDQAMRESAISQAFARHVTCERGVMRICDDLYDLNSFSRIFVISIGKAAHSMLAALNQQCGERFEGIVASSVEPQFQLRGFRYFHGGHPLPNAESVRAADAMLKSSNAQIESSLMIYLVSGGASAAAEKPIDNEISLEDVVETYRVLVHSGAAIGEINAIRKHLSAIKGGRLAQAAYPAQQVSILISDVPDGTPDALASGPTMPDSTTEQDCYAIAGSHQLRFPPSVQELFDRHALEETPKSDDPAFVRARWWTILSNSALLQEAKVEAERQGFTVEIDNSCDDWDYAKAADYLLNRLRELRQGKHQLRHGKDQLGQRKEKICLLSGGEVTVHVENGGSGGRNQQFALYCAQKIAGENICVLSAGSDGIDGNSRAAGAIADGMTAVRARAAGVDVEAHLEHFNAHPLFEALGDAVITGSTGNNLRDLRILLAP
jgi:hydroxypyruvate reductase